jgi:hypothetical protein
MMDGLPIAPQSSLPEWQNLPTTHAQPTSSPALPGPM